MNNTIPTLFVQKRLTLTNAKLHSEVPVRLEKKKLYPIKEE
jgi:hypothetical protein